MFGNLDQIINRNWLRDYTKSPIYRGSEEFFSMYFQQIYPKRGEEIKDNLVINQQVITRIEILEGSSKATLINRQIEV